MPTNLSFSGAEGGWKARLDHSVKRFLVEVDASKHQANNFIAVILINEFVSAKFHNLLSAISFLREKSVMMYLPSIDIQNLKVNFIIFVCVHVCLCE